MGFLSTIPWWGWVLIVLAAIVIAPIKLRIFKSMLMPKEPKESDEE